MAIVARPDRSGLLKSLGPGLIWAAAAIGVSHLVQSTRAGAIYGYGLVAVVLLANLLKYPFFEFGPRYAAATGESLLEGYRRQGRWVVVVYLVLTLGTMFAVTGAVTLVTGSLATQVFGEHLSPLGYSAALLVLCALVLVLGRYPALDKAVKAIMVVLTVSTVVAVVAALLAGPRGDPAAVAPPLLDGASFAFLIALVGWMPSAIDISVWHSLWTLERARETGYRPRLSEVLFDFNLGYLTTAVLALMFLALGALVFFGTGVELESSGTGFAAQLIQLYTEALGPWSRPLIVVAAFVTMFSTTLTVTDAFPRALRRAVELLVPRLGQGTSEGLYWGLMVVLISGSLLLLSAFGNRLRLMVDVATTLSFLTAPVLSWFNYRCVTGANVPAEAVPPGWLRVLSWIGLVAGTLFAAVFLVHRFVLG